MRPLLLLLLLPVLALAQDNAELIDEIRAAGIRSELGAKGYSSQYIDWYINRLPKEVYKYSRTAAQIVEEEKLSDQIDQDLAAVRAEKARRAALKAEQSQIKEEALRAELAILQQQVIELQKAVANLKKAQTGP